MYEFLFRGWDGLTGWRYGSLIYIGSPENCYIYCPGCHPANYQVNPDTLGQWVWKVDKNGKKVFSGDICRCEMLNDNNEPEVVGDFLVEINKENAQFWLINDECSLEFEYLSGFEVIGDIRNNPKWLEEHRLVTMEVNDNGATD